MCYIDTKLRTAFVLFFFSSFSLLPQVSTLPTRSRREKKPSQRAAAAAADAAELAAGVGSAKRRRSRNRGRGKEAKRRMSKGKVDADVSDDEEDIHDSSCRYCQKGGDLLCCGSCTYVFHIGAYCECLTSPFLNGLDATINSFFIVSSSISTDQKKAADPCTGVPCVGGVSALVRTCTAATFRTYVVSFPSFPPFWDGAGCLKPPLAQIPPGDWSCEYCTNSDNEHERDADAAAAAGGGDAAEGGAAVAANGDAAAVLATVRMPVSGSFTPPMAKVGNSGVPPPTLTAATSATPASALVVSSSSSAAAAAIAVAAAAAAAGSAPTPSFPSPASPYSSPPGAARAAVTPTAAALVAQHTARTSSRGGNRASAGSREGSPAKKVRLSSTAATAAATSPAFDTHPGNSEMVMVPFVAASVRSNASSAAKAAAHQYPVERSDTHIKS